MNRTKSPQPRTQLQRIVRDLGGILGETEDFVDPRSEVDRLFAGDNAPLITHREWLARHGLVFPTAGTLPPERVPAELNRLIAALAFARVFIEGTNHLSDIQLYDRLNADVLEGEEPDVPRMDNESFHWDLSETGNPHSKAWLSYYASDDERRDYRDNFPSRAMPPRRTFPFNRDVRLPRPC